VYAAMAHGFSGTGHWYCCENGGLFTMGECGMPWKPLNAHDIAWMFSSPILVDLVLLSP
jgi:hypothetical protein